MSDEEFAERLPLIIARVLQALEYEKMAWAAPQWMSKIIFGGRSIGN